MYTYEYPVGEEIIKKKNMRKLPCNHISTCYQNL